MDLSSKKSTRGTLTLVLIVSVGLHLIALFIFGVVKIAQAVMREEVAFEAPPLPPPPEEIPEFEVNLEQRNEESSPPRPNPIVVDSPDIALPALNIDLNLESTSSYGRGSGGFGSGSGGGQIREMAIDLTKFGYSGFVEGTLEGSLFDLKHDPSGKPLIEYNWNDSGVENHVGGHAGRIIREFANGSWSLTGLKLNYKQAEEKLYGAYFIIPSGDAGDAPRAFDAEDEIKAKAILAIYSGTFVPSKSGRFRFAGRGDDSLIVRVRSRVVLDASYGNGYSSWNQNEAEQGKSMFGIGEPLIYGDWISLTAGTPTKIEVLIAEAPGGLFGAYLLLQEDGEDLEIFSTKELTSKEKRLIRDSHPDAGKLL